MEFLNMRLHLEEEREREHSSLGQEELCKKGNFTWGGGGGGGWNPSGPPPPPLCIKHWYYTLLVSLKVQLQVLIWYRVFFFFFLLFVDVTI